MNNETESFLATALSYVQRKDTEEDTSLTAGMAIPSHEEVNSEVKLWAQSPALCPRLSLNRQLMGILKLTFYQLQHWHWITGWKNFVYVKFNN